jgi:hypothetical protein
MKRSNGFVPKLTRIPLAGALLGCIALLSPMDCNAATTLVSAGSTWRYLDDGSNQGTAWSAVAFNDGGWKSGRAQLGYGDGDEVTVIGYGSNANAKFITSYFRLAFNVADPAGFTALTLRLLRDDGAVVYLNGTEVFRSNLPSGTIGYTTLAPAAIGGTDETTFVSTALSPDLLRAGQNVLAVELHQCNGTSTDVSFDLELTGTAGASVVRGPYLQQAGPTSVIARWRTDVLTDSRVRFGLDPASLVGVADDATLTTEHQVLIQGLTPNSLYYYSVGTALTTLAGDADHLFYTAPPWGAAQAIRVWALSDYGTATTDELSVRNGYLKFTGQNYTDVWLTMGDNEQTTGADSLYQAALFDPYAALLRKSAVWPAIGNHDMNLQVNPPPTQPYYRIFTLPTEGEIGGLRSGTEDYYSFDYANAHFVCLDSMTSDRSATAPMALWLESDLAATTQRWIIAYWHHPPYSKGTHDSDTSIESTEMRQNLLPVLEQGGADLVLCGHSHVYERSYLLEGHYGLSSTFTSAMKRDGGNGRTDGDGAYTKLIQDLPLPQSGTVYVVAGVGGRADAASFGHPAMAVSMSQLGSLVIDVHANRLEARFIDPAAAVRDAFTIVKSSHPPRVTVVSPAPGAQVPAGIPLLVCVEAADDVDGIKQVAFYVGSTLLGVDVTAPFEMAWTPTEGIYTISARAADAEDAVTASAPVAVTAIPGPPAAPGGLTATAVSNSRIDLAWTDLANNETGFRIERSLDGSSFSEIATVNANTTSFADVGLSRLTTYSYRAAAYNAAGASLYSGMAQATTQADPPPPPATLVAPGSVWKYLDTGADPGVAWRTSGFNDSAWKSGAAQLGYGDGDEATVVGYGPNASSKFITTWFRRAFTVDSPTDYAALTLRLLRDDGALVFLNGVEIFRSNLPSGNIGPTTLASTAVGGADETNFFSTAVAPTALVAGQNLLAVEIHQSGGTSTDVSFDLELKGTLADPPRITQGPWLQNVTADSMVVRWETDIAADSRVDWGLTAPGEFSAGDGTRGTRHEILLTALAANTAYHYAVKSGRTLSSTSSFRAAPTTDQPFRMAVYGDTHSNIEAHSAVVQSILGHSPQLLFHVGDFTADGSTRAAWQSQFFDPEVDLLRQVPLFAVPGDSEASGAGQAWFQDFFTLPNNEQWFAFTYGCARIVGLSSCAPLAPGTEQYAWLTAELASAEWQAARWHLVLLHHPPFTSRERETGLIPASLRTHLVPLFEQSGVQVVLSGDDNNYRRSFRQGIQYVVTGGGGAPLLDVGTPGSDATLVVAESTLEHSVIDISPDRLDFYAARTDGTILDSFSLNSDTTAPAISALAAVDITDRSARLVWTTDEPADSQVSYGPDLSSASTVNADAQVTSHSLPLTGLSPNTTYHFVVSSKDAAGNFAVSPADAFTTLPSNRAPTAASQAAQTEEDAPVSLTLTASDEDGNPLTFGVVTTPSHGALTGQPPHLTFSPEANWSGTDTFTFKVNDGQLDSAPATVAITVTPVNDTPLANAQSVTTPEDTAVAITLSGSDVEGDTLSYAVLAGPAHGTLSGSAPTLTYTPASDFNGSDTFTFKVNDGRLDSALATITITVAPVNHAPVANAQSATTPEDTALSLTLSGSDLDGDALTYTVVAGPAHGTLSGSAPTLTYTPALNYSGADAFSFKVNDGRLDSVPATVTITVTPVNDAPGAPYGLIATAGDRSVLLDWSDNTESESDLAAYRVYRRTASSTYQVVATVTGSAYTDPGLTKGTRYYYVVTAVDSAGLESPVSVEVSAIPLGPPTAPSNLAASTISRSQINLTWKDKSTDETGFAIERSLNALSFTLVATVPANTTQFSDTGLAANRLYYYRVRAYNNAGSSSYTPIVSKRTSR